MTATPLPAGSLRATSLNAARRARDLAAAADTTSDVLVVGGGTNGAAAALDASSRGLSVTLVEADDLASGAAGAHGDTCKLGDAPGTAGVDSVTAGEHRPWALTPTEAARLRTAMAGSAAYPLRAVPRLLPLGPDVSRHRELMSLAALRARDAVLRAARVPSDTLPGVRRLPAPTTLALAPGLRRDLRGGLLWCTPRPVDEARLVVALARTAAGFGARVLNRVRVRALRSDGADAVDTRTGESVVLRTRAVINATGAWVGELDPAAAGTSRRRRGLLVDADALGVADTGLMVPTAHTERFLSVFPLANGNAWLEPYDSADTETASPAFTVDHALDILSTVLSEKPSVDVFLGTSSTTIGFPSESPRGATESVRTAKSGTVTMLGGASYTSRTRAAAAVDGAIRAHDLAAGPSRTEAVSLVGSAPHAYLAETGANARIIAKYGAEAARLAALAELDPALAEPVMPEIPLTAAEVVWAVRHEAALDTEDVLRRRAGAGLAPEQRESCYPAVAELVRQALRGVSA